MMNQHRHSRYQLYAHIGSPYSMKMRAVLRYRRIPHVVRDRLTDWAKAFQNVKVPVMPVLEYPDGSFQNDSTPLILDLERRHSGRSVIPDRETDAFLAALIEDLADEWLSKSMYTYRWAFPEHTLWTGRLIAFDQLFGGGRVEIERAGHDFETRQVERNQLVGCTEANRPMLMHIADRVLGALEPNIPAQPFLFGSRPSNADFALFGQLCQFTLDLAAIAPCQEKAPYTMRWCHHVHDLSGYEGAWRTDVESVSPAVGALLDLAGDAYFPFLLANSEALEAGSERVRIEANGFAYEGAPFKYQGRCLDALRRQYADLSEGALRQLNPVLENHGCLAALRV
ncbi:MAG: glutathione S-transferase N-terminal domain-containing protein [Myxococcota bacterium]|nr:glutathione S-transferase N-terminal domain-containing protein [Myxococcota bacterium]